MLWLRIRWATELTTVGFGSTPFRQTLSVIECPLGLRLLVLGNLKFFERIYRLEIFGVSIGLMV